MQRCSAAAFPESLISDDKNDMYDNTDNSDVGAGCKAIAV
jgi:hypothetical protein